MSSHHGKFIWHELMTADVTAAAAFYQAVIGWNSRDSGLADREYMILSVDKRGVGGMMPIPEHALGAGPSWSGYIAVDDVDSIVDRITALGGAIHRPAETIPAVGRFAVVADPQGAGFIVMTPAGPQEPSGQLAPGTPGSIGWNELHAVEWETAFAFYSDLFGWKKMTAVDMGPMGTYQLFGGDADAIGGMMTKMDVLPRPMWNYYVNVDGIDAAAARAKANGGQVLNGPHEVPGGSWVVQCLDPQGAMFAMVSPTR